MQPRLPRGTGPGLRKGLQPFLSGRFIPPLLTQGVFPERPLRGKRGLGTADAA